MKVLIKSLSRLFWPLSWTKKSHACVDKNRNLDMRTWYMSVFCWYYFCILDMRNIANCCWVI
jgi:hypothetical protein